VSNKTNRIEIGLQLSNYNKFTDTSRNEEFHTQKPLSPILACISVNNSRQTGFWALASHMLYTIGLNVVYELDLLNSEHST